MTLQAPEATGGALTRERLLEIAHHLRMTRALEERIVALFRQSKVIGGIYRSLGQEGESVATAYALDFSKGDVISPLIRNLGSMLVAGRSRSRSSASTWRRGTPLRAGAT